MEKKQTAVEFYRTELSALVSMKESKFQNENEIFEQAKKMEREQIINAFSEATRMIDINDELSARFNACLYYVQTYKGKDE
jgi:hypothetical protein